MRLVAICAAAILTVALGDKAAMAVPSLNLTPALADSKEKLAQGGQLDILILGDSLSFSTPETTYLTYFRNLLQSRYGDAGHGYQGASLWSGAGFNNDWTGPVIASDPSPHQSLDGLWKTYLPLGNWPYQAYLYPEEKKTQLQYVVQPGGGSFQVRRGFDGEVVTTINTSSATTGLGTYNYQLAPNETSYTILPVGNGSFTLLGQNTTTDLSGVRVHRAANGGWGVNNFNQRDWTFDSQMQAINPDLVMVWIGQNDQGFNRASYRVALNQLVERVQATSPTAEIVLIGTYDSGSPAIPHLVGAMEDVATETGIGFINIFESAGNYQFFQDRKFLSDGIHFSAAGAKYLGHMMNNTFLYDGQNLSAIPGNSNFDEQVNILDLTALASHWQSAGTWADGDFNYDGFVDILDLRILASNWQSGAAPGPLLADLQAAMTMVGLGNVSLVPEPTSIAILPAGLLLLRRRRCI